MNTNGENQMQQPQEPTVLVLLARLYCDVYRIRKVEEMSDNARLMLQGIMSRIAECMVTGLLATVGENPRDRYPPE